MGRTEADARGVCNTHGFSMIAAVKEGSRPLALPPRKGKRIKVEIEGGVITKVVGEG